MSPVCQLPRFCRGAMSPVVLRRTVCGILTIAFIVVAAGVPLPTVSRPAKSGELFPCATTGCGCDSAEKCWRSCCCHTLAERLAWAEKNGVEPPAFALAEAAKAGLDSTGRPLAHKFVNASLATKTCCKSKHSCCSNTETKSCCSHAEKPSDNKSDFIVAWRALGCHGHSLNWLAAVPTLISVDLNLSDQLPLAAWLGPHSSDIATGVSDVPTPPPPERA